MGGIDDWQRIPEVGNMRDKRVEMYGGVNRLVRLFRVSRGSGPGCAE